MRPLEFMRQPPGGAGAPGVLPARVLPSASQGAADQGRGGRQARSDPAKTKPAVVRGLAHGGLLTPGHGNHEPSRCRYRSRGLLFSFPVQYTPGMNRFCTNCGSPAPEGAIFCGGCGTPIQAPKAAAPAPPPPPATPPPPQYSPPPQPAAT
ncbi:MAG TPA: hypothetical protein DCY80_16950, partial [Solibacterales bacterium]|nr:hypothetical protein [Bryobacterales bacterium]